MRSAARISKTPQGFRRDEAAERQRILAELLEELGEARDTNAPWYVWVRDEWPKMKAPRP